MGTGAVSMGPYMSVWVLDQFMVNWLWLSLPPPHSENCFYAFGYT